MFLYLKHLLLSKGPDRVHSPFVFDLYFHVLRNKSKHYSFAHLEDKFETTEIQSSSIIGESIFKIINKLKPQNIVYISDYSLKNLCYAAEAKKSSKIFIWGNKWGKDSIKSKAITKNNNIFPITKSQNSKVDMLVIDTISPNDILSKIQLEKYTSVLVTNIGNNKKNRSLWNDIVKQKKQNICIDCYYFGLCIQRPEQISEYFSLRL